MEYWKEIEGFEGLYDVSSLGRIRSHERICKAANGTFQKKRARILTQEITIHGYCRVRLYDGEGMPKHYSVHRLVANAFINKVESDKQINHKNEIKTDNRVENLEICTAKQNCNYGTRNERLSARLTDNSKICKPVVQCSKDGRFIKRFESIKAASIETKIDAGHIGNCANGKRKSAGGYVWSMKWTE